MGYRSTCNGKDRSFFSVESFFSSTLRLVAESKLSILDLNEVNYGL